MAEKYGIEVISPLELLIENAFQTRAEYHRMMEYFGPVAPLAKLTESQQRHVFKLLQLFWGQGYSPPHDTFLHFTKPIVTLRRGITVCLDLEQKNIRLCETALNQTKNASVQRVVSSILRTTKVLHEPLLSGQLRLNRDHTDRHRLPATGTSRAGTATLRRREFSVSPESLIRQVANF